ncbi:MAG: FAD-dependent oxidoreductase [Actinobacteria bacterium]|nr:FAD-dependent oxidoreductase [Actinomycetota bacterium]
MTQERFDVLVVGAGVVGLSVASALLELNPSRKILVLDKESELGKHASGRNSGVLHAGFYYSPDSLKARFCRDGCCDTR